MTIAAVVAQLEVGTTQRQLCQCGADALQPRALAGMVQRVEARREDGDREAEPIDHAGAFYPRGTPPACCGEPAGRA